MKQYYIFDNLEIIMGPYETVNQARADMDLHIDELYLLDYYPEPYIDTIGMFDDEEFEEYSPEDISKRGRIIKRKERYE
jgi:hypothetical protein